MARLPDDVIGDAYTSTFGWELLEGLVDLENRMAGQAGEAEAARLVAATFEDAGLENVETVEFDVPGWWRGRSSLTLSAPRERRYEAVHEVIALPGTPAGTVEGGIVDVGYGTDEEFEAADIEGHVAMARSDVPDDHDRWIHRMEKYAAACEAGAVGFVFRNHVEGCLPPTGEVGYFRRPGPIPAVGVSKEVGARLARYAADECAGTLAVECRNEPATSQNVEATVGPDTADEVLLTAHVDAHDVAEGAGDNGAGTAIVAEAGRLLAAVADELDTRARLIAFGAEELSLNGAYHWAETHDLDRVKAVLNVDGAGNSGDLRISPQGFETLATVIESVTDELDAPLATSDSVSPNADQWPFVQEGVPATFVGTQSGESGRGWGHTHADTLDKLDVRDLRDVAIQVASCVLAVAADEHSFERRPREESRDKLTAGHVRALKVGGRWPYDAA